MSRVNQAKEISSHPRELDGCQKWMTIIVKMTSVVNNGVFYGGFVQTAVSPPIFNVFFFGQVCFSS